MLPIDRQQNIHTVNPDRPQFTPSRNPCIPSTLSASMQRQNQGTSARWEQHYSAALAGDAKAQFQIGHMYSTGDGIQ